MTHDDYDDDLDERNDMAADAALVRRLCGDELHDALGDVTAGPDADDWLDDARLMADEGAIRMTGAALWRLLWAGDAEACVQARDELVERLRALWHFEIEQALDAEACRQRYENLGEMYADECHFSDRGAA